MAIPAPEPGLVVNYAYLWHRDHAAGSAEGQKDRPSVIVLAKSGAAGSAVVVTVLPITHSPPVDSRVGVEIPSRVKRQLDLDDARSWVIVAEGNKFVWPGHDLRKRAAANLYDYGFLPPRLFYQIQDAFVACHRAGIGRTVPRD